MTRPMALGDGITLFVHAIDPRPSPRDIQCECFRHARLMLFDRAVALPERLVDQTCTPAVQDDSFFAYYFADPSFAARFSGKLGFTQVPWGMGVARDGSERLARALDLMSQIFHRDGIFLAAAHAKRCT